MTTIAISSTNDKSSDASLESIFNSEIRFATEKKNPLRIASKRVFKYPEPGSKIAIF